MRVICLVLCAATWRGPVPWIHEHPTDAAIAADPSLARHLASYHAGRRQAEPGWHWHILLPFSRCPCTDPDQEPASPEDPLSVYGALLSTGASSISPAASCQAWHVDIVDIALFSAVGGAAHESRGKAPNFLGSLLQSAPLRAVTGVALC